MKALYTESQAREVARDLSSEIVIRTYDHGCSRDERRAATEVERAVIEKIMCGCLLEVRTISGTISDSISLLEYYHRVRCVIDAGEFILMGFIPECNTYDTFFTPITGWLNEISEEED